MLSGATAPSHPHLNLRTDMKIFATDATGKILTNPSTGKPVLIAQDVTTGQWYEKVADSMPAASASADTKKAFSDVGAVHVAHENETFRGVWAKMPEAKKASQPAPAQPATSTNKTQ